MKFYESQTLERIGFDFYCDIANNIVKARKEKQLTQEELATKANIRLSRLSGIENVKIRLDLDDLKKLSRTLDVFEKSLRHSTIMVLSILIKAGYRVQIGYRVIPGNTKGKKEYVIEYEEIEQKECAEK